jgi:hypothetical protein
MNLLRQAIDDDSVRRWEQTLDCCDAFASGRSATLPIGP